MSDPTYPCTICNRYTCRCSERSRVDLAEQRQSQDWTPWWHALASNA